MDNVQKIELINIYLVFFLSLACGEFDAGNPFLCMDLVYINTLLTHGYGFSGDTELVVSKDSNPCNPQCCTCT